MNQKHSALGIASFIVSTIVGVLMFLLIIIAAMMEASTPGGIDEKSSSAILVGLFMIAFLAVDVVAVGLGITGLTQKDRKKVFSTLGVVIGATTIVGTIFLSIIGTLM